MKVSRRDWRMTSTALRSTLAPFYAYTIPSDQPEPQHVPPHIVERGRALGLRFGKLAVTQAAGRA